MNKIKDRILSIIALSKDRHGVLTWAEREIVDVLNEQSDDTYKQERDMNKEIVHLAIQECKQ